MSQLKEGDTLGRFTITGLLGTGGMSVVYGGCDPQLQRKVALKVLRPTKSGGQERIGRLFREAQAMARLSHPCVVQVFEVGVGPAGEVFLAMEHVDGQPLDQWLLGVRSQAVILRTLLQAGRGLAAAHRNAIVHRDFKPSNVMVDRHGCAKILDFGLACGSGISGSFETTESDLDSSHATPELTRAGTVVGTPLYMAPEQHRTSHIDARADQFAFCAVVYECLTGSRAFHGHTPRQLLEAKVRAVPLRRRPVKIPRKVWSIIRRGLDPDPARRWPDMELLLRTLEASLRPPVVRPALLATFGVVVTGAGLSVLDVKLPSTGEDACESGAEQLAHVWNDARESGLQEVLARTASPSADETVVGVIRELDGFFSRWQASFAETCVVPVGTETIVSVAPDSRRRCLEDALHQAAGLVHVLERADAEIARVAPELLSQLPPMTRCDHPAAPSVAPSVATGDVEMLWRAREQVAAARARFAAGQVDAARDLARTISVRSEALEYAPVRAELHLLLGQIHAHEGDLVSARDALEQAFFVAREHHYSDTAADAALRLANVIGLDQGHPEEGLGWAEHARAEVDRLGDRGRLGQLETVIGLLHESMGRYDAAIAAHDKALRHSASHQPRIRHQAAIAHANLGKLQLRSGDPALAVWHLEQSRQIDRSIAWHRVDIEGLVALGLAQLELGEAQVALATLTFAANVEADSPHPRVVGALAKAHLATGDLARARRLAEQALEEHVASDGPRHIALLPVLLTLAEIESQLQDPEAALALLDRAQSLALAAAADDSLAHVVAQRGAVLQRRRQFSNAQEAFQEAVELERRAFGWNSLRVATALSALGSVAELRGRWYEAAEHHRAALARRTDHLRRHDALVARSHLRLGSVLRELDDPEALHHLEAAVDQFNALHLVTADALEANYTLARAYRDAGNAAQMSIIIERLRNTAWHPSPLLPKVERWLQS